MKPFLILLLLVSATSHAQKMVLVDRNFQQPLIFADSITIEQVAKGLLPIHFNDLDQVIRVMEKLTKDIYAGRMNSKETTSVPIGSSVCIITMEKLNRSNLYNIILNTTTGNLKTHIVLAQSEPHKRAAQRLTIFIDYLKNNAAIVLEK